MRPTWELGSSITRVEQLMESTLDMANFRRACENYVVLLIDMAPKKKRACHRPSFDQSRFLSEAGQVHFMNKFSNRIVVPERIVMYNELDETDFVSWMREREWFTLYDLGYQIVVNWVREFYANMYEVTDTSFKTFVRGYDLEITPDFLSQVLEIERVEGAHFPIMGNCRIDYNLVAKKLTDKPVAWVGSDISRYKLTDSYRLLSIFTRHNLCPKVSKKVTKEDGYLLYCIGTQRKVDVPLAVYHGMAKIHTAPHNTALPFLGLVSKMLMELGKLAEPNEDIIIPKQKIDHLTLEKSKSHIPTVELDGDDDEDTGGPSGANTSEAAPAGDADHYAGPSGEDQRDEGAIHALNERIGRLEGRVNDGFAEMRQSLADILSHLRQAR